MKVLKGQYTVIKNNNTISANSIDKANNDPNKSDKKDQGDPSNNPIFTDKTIEMDDIPEVGDEVEGLRVTRNAKGELETTGKATDITNKKGKSKTYNGKKLKSRKDWDNLKAKALSENGDSVNKRVKELLNRAIGKIPMIDWKKELRKFFDNAFNSMESVIPNRRLLGSDIITYGQRRVGDNTLRVIVAAVDTSGSISRDQIKIFLNEVMYLCKTFEADKIYIIYCSDDIDSVDVVKKGGTPDLSKIASTGGNSKGFIPPFEYVERNKIKPSVFIYLTDTGGDMPKEKDYGIKKYSKKVVWFICSPTVYNHPPFGKIMYAPVRGIKLKGPGKIGREEGEIWDAGSAV